LPRESNPTLRVVRILDFLASRPQESFGLSEVARILQMNKATCLTILGGLVDTGYLLLDPESKSYSLGPSSIALGHAAASTLPALDPAIEIMHDLRDELGLECVAMVRAANHLVLLGPQGPRGLLTPITGRPGFRAPFVPPMGATLMAFAPPSELEQWYGRADPALTEAETTHLWRVLASVRARGFLATRRTIADTLLEDAIRGPEPDPYRRLYQLSAGAIRQVRETQEPYIVVDIDEHETYPISTVVAPVFGARSTPEFSLVVEGFRWDVTGTEIRSIGARMVAASTKLCRSLGGDPPPFRPHSDARADR
jgi:DNA-binding IclR family transcriptional regulator